ncbi:MAG: HD-GYP domain-containing protein [Limnochordaceae bacterium]|nr:HD-GYP domain-containing protein [Limnochordaceae bacterium]
MDGNAKKYIIIWTAAALAVALIGASYDRRAISAWPIGVLFVVVAALTQRLSIQISPKVTASFALPVLYAAGIITGPFMGGLIALLAPMFLNPEARHWSWRAYVFNHSQVAIATVLGTLSYYELRAHPGTFGWRDIIAMMVGAFVAWVSNVAAVSAIISATTGSRLVSTFNYHLKGLSTDYIAITSMAILMAGVYFAEGWIGLALFFLPLLVARRAIVMYADMKRAYADTIASLSAALEARDAYTAGHSRRVAEIAVRIGHELGMSDNDLETLKYAGLLHDIGKIGIEDRLLKKPARFTPEEYREITQHSSLTGAILEGVAGFEKVNDWARHHHERYDGSGYPDGLEGDKIPLGARILAVADAFDAMASRRVYKPSIPFGDILVELLGHRGTQFDPKVLDAFVRVMEEPGFREWLEGELPYFRMPKPEEVTSMVKAAWEEVERGRGSGAGPRIEGGPAAGGRG